ncbi:MAG: SpoIIE family protein phosphatase [bacterium]|nr:SpoIIE family protein phosphatase [bacterium]
MYIVKRIILSISILSCCIAATTIDAKTIIDTPASNTDTNLLPTIENIKIFHDRDNTITINDITHERYAEKFIDLKKAKKALPENKFIYFWGKLTIRNNSKKNSKFVLLSTIVQIAQSTDLYKKDTDTYKPVPSINKHHKSFNISINPGTTATYYFRCYSFGYALNFDIKTPKSFFDENKKEYAFYGLFIGIVLIMAFYNLFLFFSFRDLSYIYYVSWIITFGLLQLILNGYFFLEIRFYSRFILFSTFRSLSVISFGLFSCSLLNSKKYTPRFKKAINIFIIIIAILTIIFNIKAINFGENILNLSFLVLFISLFILGIITWRKGYPPAKYFIIATSSLVITGFLYPLSYYDWTPYTLDDLTNYKVMDSGGLFMIFMFSLALADRINIMKKEKENAQTDALNNLKQADKLKDEFLSNTSHELRTPLNGIIGITESLVDGARGPLPDSAKRDLEMVTASGKRLSNLVNDILDFSQLKNKDIKLQLRPVDLRSVIELVLRISEPLLGGKQVVLVDSTPKDLPPLLADENRLQQILYNLVGNAIKFTTEGKIEVSGTVQDGRIAITVSDTGIGIWEDKLSAIFNPFEQADGTISRLYGGTGIGLTITKYLVNLHGGDIIVDSEVNKGSTFTFSIPLHINDSVLETPAKTGTSYTAPYHQEPATEEIQDLQPAGKESTDSNNPIVLIVDDDIVNLQVVENMLSLQNYTIRKASSGPEALEQIKKEAPDIVLLDIMMPGMSGYDVSGILREKYSLFDMPIVMLTAKSRISDIVAGFEAGANDYLPKPFDRTELLARVQTLVELKRAVKESQKLIVIEQQLNFARNIQMSTIPKDLPQSPYFNISACYVPAETVGGDFFNFHPVDEKKIGILISDVSGHGVPAALITSMVKIVFNTLKSLREKPVELLQEMKHMLSGNIESQFITASYIFLDLEVHKLYYARAGHEPLLILKKDSLELQKYMPHGSIIGYFKDKVCEPVDIDLETQDRIILYTDCVTEAINEDSEMYGMARFNELIKETSQNSPEEFINRVREELSTWTGREENFEDDLTMVVIDITT